MRRRFTSGKGVFNPDKYLTIEALEDGLQVSHPSGFEYKTNNSEWQRCPQYELTPEINRGECLYIRANWTFGGALSFTITKYCNLRGNCLSLLFKNNADKQCDISQFPQVLQRLFGYCPIIEVSSDFLPATILAKRCYERMFDGCTSLTTAPSLPATTLADSCYSSMFDGCTKLNYIKMLATDISASGCLNYWVRGVSGTGTFVKNVAMTSLPTGRSGIPEGWTVVNDGEENSLTFPVTLVEGDNGQLGIDVYNYLFNKYFQKMYINEDLSEDDVIIINGSLSSKIPEINTIQFTSGDSDDYGYIYNSSIRLSYGRTSDDFYILGDNGHLGPYDG